MEHILHSSLEEELKLADHEYFVGLYKYIYNYINLFQIYIYNKRQTIYIKALYTRIWSTVATTKYNKVNSGTIGKKEAIKTLKYHAT